MKSVAVPFSIAGALLIAALLVVTNLLTTPGVLWFIPPVVLAAGWPAGVLLCRRQRYGAFSVAGSLLVIAFLAVLNWLVSPHTLWFAYAVPLVLMWPAGTLLKGKMTKLPVALILGAFIIAYCLTLNLLLTPHVLWAHHAVFAALWWPMSLYFTGRHEFKRFSVAGAVMTVAYLIGSNLLGASYPWALYACFPVVWWPLAVYFGKRLGAFKFSLIGSACTLAWYGALNLWLEPGSPWILFIAFALAWWPLSVYFHGRHRPDLYAVAMSLISIAFFAAVNLIYSPGAIWAIFPAFALLWWPLSVIFHGCHRPDIYAGLMSLLTIAFLAAVNRLTSPGFLWCVFPALAVLWWPLAMAFRGRRKPFGFALAGAALAIGTLLTINLMTSPGFLWSVFPALAILWWPAAVFFSKHGGAPGFSVAGSMLVAALVVSVNLMTSPGFLWCVFPVFAVLWWPLGVLLHHRRRPCRQG